MMSQLNDILLLMNPISLADMKTVKLMNRIDTKYVVDIELLVKIIESVKNYYFVQEIDGKRIADYDTIYYDTPDNQMYMIHHDRKLTRDKLRVRSYVDTHNFFCEVKHKNNKGRTKKKRITITENDFYHPLDNDVNIKFIAEELPNYNMLDFHPNLETRFNRITLVNKDKTERITIDFNLKFNNFISDCTADLNPLCIIELKQNGRYESDFEKALFNFRVKQFKISKYCIGTAMTRVDIKQNRFKKKLRTIEKYRNYVNTANTFNSGL